MEAHAEQAHHHHHHHEHVDVNPAAWTDGKRYAWLLGIIVPLSPFLAWFWVSVTGFGALWYLGPLLVFGLFPLLDMAIGIRPIRPTASSSSSSRTATTAGAPTSSSRSSTPGSSSPAGCGRVATSR